MQNKEIDWDCDSRRLGLAIDCHVGGLMKKTLPDHIAAFGLAKDDDDTFPLVTVATVEAGSSATPSVGAPKPVATIPQLADYLINGFWQYNGMVAHHWASSTISYNINGLNAAEQLLAQSALNAWHEVANVAFVQTSGAANITFNHNGSLTAFETDDSYLGTGIITTATIDISADWITTDGGANDGKTGIDSYGYQTYIHEIGHALGLKSSSKPSSRWGKIPSRLNCDFAILCRNTGPMVNTPVDLMRKGGRAGKSGVGGKLTDRLCDRQGSRCRDAGGAQCLIARCCQFVA